MLYPKKRPAGRTERLALISATFGQGVFEGARAALRGHGVRFDDLADAFGAVWTARRIRTGTAERLPETRTLDACGVPMHIWV
jgi:predicted RNase H-like nuclease